MGRINIRGGSPLEINFETEGGKSPGDFVVKLEKSKSGKDWYRIVHEDGTDLETARGDGANMIVSAESKRRVAVDYVEKE